jgi:parallel beta-helix repeat protein
MLNSQTAKIVSQKIIDGSPVMLFSDSVTISSAKVLRVDDNGNQTVSVYYGGMLVRTLTITDVPTDSTYYVGLFSANSATTFSGFAVSSYATSPTVTRYVAKTGYDANPGSATLPRLTIGGGDDLAVANNLINTIEVAAGTYMESVVVPLAGLDYRANGAVVVNAGGTGHGFSATNKDNITLRGFEITNTGANHGVYLNSSENCVVESCVAHDCNHGFLAYGGSLNTTIRNCEAYDFGVRGFGFVLISNGVIDTCYAHDPSVGTAYGFEMEQNNGGANNSIVRDCWATGGSHAFIAKTGTGIQFIRCVGFTAVEAFYFKGAPNCSILNCVAYNCSYGISLRDNGGVAPSSTGATLTNNVIFNCIRGIYVQSGSEVDLAVDYDDIFGGTYAGSLDTTDYTSLALWQTASDQDIHSLTLDPEYASVVYGGFALPAGSQLLTAGSDGGPIGRDT